MLIYFYIFISNIMHVMWYNFRYILMAIQYQIVFMCGVCYCVWCALMCVRGYTWWLCHYVFSECYLGGGGGQNNLYFEIIVQPQLLLWLQEQSLSSL